MPKLNGKYLALFLSVSLATTIFYGCGTEEVATNIQTSPSPSAKVESTTDKVESTTAKVESNSSSNVSPSSSPKKDAKVEDSSHDGHDHDHDHDHASHVTTPSKLQYKTYNAEELAKFKGENGTTALVAVDGKVYEVTNAHGWKDGKHKNGITAGKDLSAEIRKSPHGLKVLEGLSPVGDLK